MQTEFKNKIDDDIVLKCMAGDEFAFKKIYTEYYDKVYFQAFMMLQNKEASADIVQETFITVYKQIRTLQEPKAFHNWIKKIAYHKTLDFIRKNKKQVVLTNEDIDVLYAGNMDIQKKDTNVEDTLVQEYVTKALLHLSPTLKSVALLHFYDHLSIEEIAEILNISPNLVSVRLNRSKKQMKQFLKHSEVTPSIYKIKGFAPFLIPTLTTSSGMTTNSLNFMQQYLTSAEIAMKSSGVSQASSTSASMLSKVATPKGLLLFGTAIATGIGGLAFFMNRPKEVVIPKVKITDISYNNSYTKGPIDLNIMASGKYDTVTINEEKTKSIDKNGDYVVRILDGEKVLDQKNISIRNIDQEAPVCVEKVFVDGQIVLKFTDTLSGIKKDSIRVEGLINPQVSFNQEKGEIRFPYDMNSEVHVALSDKADNFTDVYIDMVEQ